MARIFISYSRQDKTFARRLAADLDRLGGDAWIDLEDIHAADDWSDAIQGALNECQLLIVIVSPASMASKNVAEEWKYFKSRGKPILPVLWEPAEVHYQLHSLQYVDFHAQDYDTAFAQLHSELGRQRIGLAPLAASNPLVPLPAQTPLPVRPRDLTRRTVRTTALAIAGFGLAAILSLLGVFGGGNDKPTPTAAPTSTFIPAGASNNNWTPMERDFDGVTMVYVPAGCFMMGSDDGNDNERPVHRVCLSAFWIGQTEVTNAQYKRCVEAGACTLPEDRKYFDNVAYVNHPVVYVNWDQVNDFAEWIGGSLPTEAQWEYTARGPGGWVYPWGNTEPTCLQANTYDCTGGTAPVGPYQHAGGASWVGALDLSGNAGEWIADWYDSGYYATLQSGVLDPTGPVSGTARVVRGGSWRSFQSYIRCADRRGSSPDIRNDYFGFRVVMPVPE
jgi:formylglycine-generating enzyme required for sulfatase activity